MDTIPRGTESRVPIDPEKRTREPTKAIPKRRQYSKSLKRQMVEETLAGRNSVSVVARRYDVNANQLFKWRRQYRKGLLADEPQTLVPITVAPTPSLTSAPNHTLDNGSLEITLAGGHRLVVTGTVCPEVLKTALAVLSAC